MKSYTLTDRIFNILEVWIKNLGIWKLGILFTGSLKKSTSLRVAFLRVSFFLRIFLSHFQYEIYDS